MIANPHKETLVPHLVATLIYLSQTSSYYIWGDISPSSQVIIRSMRNITLFLEQSGTI